MDSEGLAYEANLTMVVEGCVFYACFADKEYLSDHLVSELAIGNCKVNCAGARELRLTVLALARMCRVTLPMASHTTEGAPSISGSPAARPT